jgi:hypothetical protein
VFVKITICPPFLYKYFHIIIIPSPPKKKSIVSLEKINSDPTRDLFFLFLFVCVCLSVPFQTLKKEKKRKEIKSHEYRGTIKEKFTETKNKKYSKSIEPNCYIVVS